MDNTARRHHEPGDVLEAVTVQAATAVIRQQLLERSASSAAAIACWRSAQGVDLEIITDSCRLARLRLECQQGRVVPVLADRPQKQAANGICLLAAELDQANGYLNFTWSDEPPRRERIAITVDETLSIDMPACYVEVLSTLDPCMTQELAELRDWVEAFVRGLAEPQGSLVRLEVARLAIGFEQTGFTVVALAAQLELLRSCLLKGGPSSQPWSNELSQRPAAAIKARCELIVESIRPFDTWCPLNLGVLQHALAKELTCYVRQGKTSWRLQSASQLPPGIDGMLLHRPAGAA